MTILGVGGLFIRARDPQALSAWYLKHLGLSGIPPSQQSAGPLVFMPFPDDSDYFARDHSFMLNLRVDDLEGLIQQLTAASIAVETRAEWNDPTLGRFARVHDPEGNPIELWQAPDEP